MSGIVGTISHHIVVMRLGQAGWNRWFFNVTVSSGNFFALLINRDSTLQSHRSPYLMLKDNKRMCPFQDISEELLEVRHKI